MVALEARHKSGKGQVIDAALYEGAFSFMEPYVPAYEKLGIVARRAGSRLPNSAPNNLYPTADGEYVHITAIADPVFRRLAKLIGREDLVSDARFAVAVERAKHVDDVDDVVTAWTRSVTAAEAERLLNRALITQAHFRDAATGRVHDIELPPAILQSLRSILPPGFDSEVIEISYHGRAQGGDAHPTL